MDVPLEVSVLRQIKQTIQQNSSRANQNLDWLRQQMPHYFFLANKDEVEALANLVAGLHGLEQNRRITLVDRDKLLMLAQLALPGSLYETLRGLPEREISYAQITTSYAPILDTEHRIEVLRFAFDRKADSEISHAAEALLPSTLRRAVNGVVKSLYPDFTLKQVRQLLNLLWLNNENYVRISPPERVARILWLFQQTMDNGGIYLDVQKAEGPDGARESRLLFGVGNPPQRGFMLQVMEVFKRLGLGVKRAYGLTISNGVHPYFLATFYVKDAEGSLLEKGSELYQQLQEELYNTQILSAFSPGYRELVAKGAASGADASLVNALIGFCHTNLAHTHPDSFDQEGVRRAFLNHPEISLQLVKLFRVRFDPALAERDSLYVDTCNETERMVEDFNTGRRFLDEFRRTIFRCALLFIRHTLKTNFFVPEKHALAFRLDPAYLDGLSEDFLSDLPPERPFRVTYFFGRFGAGYHIGFSDIARGGWRTIITHGRDDYVTCANTLFRENYVLAHTQHLKNKDIYEGGSKMVLVLDAAGETAAETIKQRLYKLQYGVINAFLDIYVTENGRAKDPRVVDYYGEDEPIELGPDENMHDTMVELVARQAVKRGYLLGAGIMSSKQVGINHKEYAVTSTGVVRFAEVAMEEIGVDLHAEPFTVKFTGGPNGDVAGNAMRLLLQRCPQVMINLIVDGSGALYDPQGADRDELSRILLKADVDAFDPRALNPGGFLLYRQQTRQEGMRKLFRKIVRNEAGLEEQWVSNDEFYREFNTLIFSVPADLFIPAGGRPETIDAQNCRRLLDGDGQSNSRVIVEGANSFITPEARIELQRRGAVLMRDASANKCGVISSSYEIIANLLLSEKEFIAHKERYVADVVAILNRRAEDEARLIFRRWREAAGKLLFTEISDAISMEINAHYARLFDFFQQNPQLCDKPLYRRAILAHLPGLLGEVASFRKRIGSLPAKIKYAILASEIASSMVYLAEEEQDYAEVVECHLQQMSAC